MFFKKIAEFFKQSPMLFYLHGMLQNTKRSLLKKYQKIIRQVMIMGETLGFVLSEVCTKLFSTGHIENSSLNKVLKNPDFEDTYFPVSTL